MPSRSDDTAPPTRGSEHYHRTGLNDTSPDAARVQIEIVRAMSIPQRLHLFGQLCEMVREMAMAGLRSRHPEASESELFRRYVDITLGPELAQKAYGPLPEHESEAQRGQ